MPGAIRAFVLWAADTKMPHVVAVKTNSLDSRCELWAQTGVLKCNASGVGGGVALMKGRARVSRDIHQSSGG